MSTGEVLDRTFNLYRNNFQLFAGIATILSLLSLVGALLLVFMGGGALTAGDELLQEEVSLQALDRRRARQQRRRALQPRRLRDPARTRGRAEAGPLPARHRPCRWR